jgi:hypothetical protein
MTDTYRYVTGQDGEVYQILPTEALVRFLQRLAEGEHTEQKMAAYVSDYSGREALPERGKLPLLALEYEAIPIRGQPQ